jgi:hypothetical protein
MEFEEYDKLKFDLEEITEAIAEQALKGEGSDVKRMPQSP